MVFRKRKHNFDDKYLDMLTKVYNGSKISDICKEYNINKMTFYNIFNKCMKAYEVNTKYKLFVNLVNDGLIG